MKPRLQVLAPQDRERIHRTALRILSELGMLIQHDEARALLADAGCQVGGDDVIHIPPEVVERAVDSAPKSVVIYDRLGQRAMDLGGDRSYFGTGSDLLYTLDPESGERHRSVLEDVRRAGRVADALPNIDFVMTLAHPSDVPPSLGYLLGIQALMQSSSKPVVCTADTRRDLSAMWELACLLCGGEQQLRDRPYLINYSEPVSPLKHPHFSLDKLLLCADKGLPLVYSPAPIAGSTAPMTIAGHVAQGLAECFAGLVIHQLRAPGAPFIMGMGPAVLDMITAECSYNAPEYYMAFMTMMEMSHHYDLPSWGYAGTSDAQLPDGQATLEGSMISLLAAMTGGNLNHDVGYLNFGRTASLEMLVIMDEIVGQLRRMMQGIEVDDEHLALEAIRESRDSGNFLGHPHTRRHVRSVQWRPRLLSRLGYDRWQQEGGTTLLHRARVRLQQILSDHQPVPLTKQQLQAMQACVDRFEEQP